MQIEITLLAAKDAAYSARDLGFLLHKNPGHVHERETAAGKVTIFYPEAGDERTTALIYLDIDPVGLVRGKNRQTAGLLAHYVNDRPYVANSFLSVALSRSFGQSMAGKSKEKPELADQELPFEARIVPAAAAGGADVIEALFAPLGYQVDARPLSEDLPAGLFDLRVSGTVRLAQLLNHLYVLVPVLDNAKHYWIDLDEIDKLLAKGEGWLAGHPAKELIARRALKHRRSLANQALQRLAESPEADDEAAGDDDPVPEPEEALEKPIRLHDLRLDTVVETLQNKGVRTVLDLGCGEGKLISRLVKLKGIDRIVGVDASVHTIEKAVRRLHLDRAGDALRERLQLRLGSLTYGDRGWRNFDAATLVEVIEHIDPPRLSSLEMSVFGDARPSLVVVTTPNCEYNALFEGMPAGAMRHPDHRFEWTRQEFKTWADRIAADHGYTVALSPLGPEDITHGAPSQMAVFDRGAA
ncbi:MAG: 3' terminal RNA ribose 2'-O-methyltransferase Hen1 [Rhizobiales bacterium]|nr:3' terminal RNA ribose 2'-O-methyltransferase Hen1 [Hyphomicrobiales bacterium]